MIKPQFCGISKSRRIIYRIALVGRKEFSSHPMKRYRWHRLLPGCVALSVLLALSPAAAQEAPELYSLPVHPDGQADKGEDCK